MTFTEAKAAITTGCSTRATRLIALKALLDATEEALFDAAAGGAVTQYKVNTGQTVIDVQVTDFGTLQRSWRDLNAFYNELCQLMTGGNVMVCRDGGTLWR